MTWYGACGVEFCADCLPIYDADNNPVGDEPPVNYPPGTTATDG